MLSRSSTPQGLSANSVWSRGQAWALNGFTTAFRFTRLQRFLDAAQRAADAFIRLATACCADTLVPLWDFNATAPSLHAVDTAAAAVAASGLVELSTYTVDPRQSRSYLDAARLLVAGLQSRYLFTPGDSDAVLRNGTQAYPTTGIPLIYGASESICYLCDTIWICIVHVVQGITIFSTH